MPRTGADETVTYLPEDKNLFGEGSDIWEALNAGREVTIDRNGFIVDIWDPVSKNTYDLLGNVIGTRDTAYSIGVPFNRDTATEAELDAEINRVGVSINVEMDALLKTRVTLSKKWRNLVNLNNAKDNRNPGYQKRSFQRPNRIRRGRPAS